MDDRCRRGAHHDGADGLVLEQTTSVVGLAEALRDAEGA